MEDLGFTERWLVVDIRVEGGLDTWDGVEQICDPARAATFIQVTGDRYRWEFRLRDGEDEACLITPQALGELLRPWTGRWPGTLTSTLSTGSSATSSPGTRGPCLRTAPAWQSDSP